MNFLLSYVVLAEIYVLLALSVNLLVGIVGVFTVSQAAIFGVGAYVLANSTVGEVIGFWPSLVLAAAVCLTINILITLPALRVSGDYFVVTSFGMQLLATAVFLNWTGGTGGASGFAGIPAPALFGIDIDTPARFVWLSSIAALVGVGCFHLLLRSPYGLLLHAVREDETAVAAAGKNVLYAKVSAAAVAGVYAGIAGALYAAFLSFIDPSSFDLDASIIILTMVVVGGARTLAGSVVGPFLLLALPQLLTLVDIPTAIAAPMRQLIYGALLVAFMLFRPQGLLGQKL